MSSASAPIGTTGSDAGKLNAGGNVSDALASSPSHDREQGLPGQAKSAFSHANDFKDGDPAGDKQQSAPDSVEVLSADTPADNQGNSKFMASLEEAKQKQEENHSTAI